MDTLKGIQTTAYIIKWLVTLGELGDSMLSLPMWEGTYFIFKIFFFYFFPMMNMNSFPNKVNTTGYGYLISLHMYPLLRITNTFSLFWKGLF